MKFVQVAVTAIAATDYAPGGRDVLAVDDAGRVWELDSHVQYPSGQRVYFWAQLPPHPEAGK